MMTLQQLNECFFSSDAVGHLLSLDIDYISMKQIQQRTIRALRARATLAPEHLEHYWQIH